MLTKQRFGSKVNFLPLNSEHSPYLRQLIVRMTACASEGSDAGLRNYSNDFMAIHWGVRGHRAAECGLHISEPHLQLHRCTSEVRDAHVSAHDTKAVTSLILSQLFPTRGEKIREFLHLRQVRCGHRQAAELHTDLSAHTVFICLTSGC